MVSNTNSPDTEIKTELVEEECKVAQTTTLGNLYRMVVDENPKLKFSA